jgi:hypothetical protein
MTDDAAFGRQIDFISGLWRFAQATPPHAAGCTCMGGFAIPPPSPGDLEEDLLFVLRTRYVQGDRHDLVALIDDRSSLDGKRPSFEAWLRSLPTSGIPKLSYERFLDDLEAVLQSCREDASRTQPNGFVCF